MNQWMLADQLAIQAARIESMLGGVSDHQMRWKPGPDDWSMLEVINHLYDEEREDFRTRLDILLHRPEDPMPPIHPGQWVTERAYNDRDPGESLANFLIERERSIAWLRELENPDWDQAATTPNGRPFHAGDMAASWAAHDLLHLRQLIELHWAWNLQASEPYNVEYAGDW